MEIAMKFKHNHDNEPIIVKRGNAKNCIDKMTSTMWWNDMSCISIINHNSMKQQWNERTWWSIHSRNLIAQNKHDQWWTNEKTQDQQLIMKQ
jgi:hypothetical protein